MDYVASMEPPSSSAGALKSTSSHNPSAQGPGDAFHVLQWRDITEASSTLSCRSSNNASKHQINPPPLDLSFEMKDRGDGSAHHAPRTPPLHFHFSHCKHLHFFHTEAMIWGKGCAWLLFWNVQQIKCDYKSAQGQFYVGPPYEKVKTAYYSLWDCNSRITIANTTMVDIGTLSPTS